MEVYLHLEAILTTMEQGTSSHTHLVWSGTILTWSHAIIQTGELKAITIHVGNIASIGEDSFVKSIIKCISSRSKISSHEELRHFLSMNIWSDVPNQNVFLNQQDYIRDLPSHFLANGHVSVRTPTLKSFKDLVPQTSADAPATGGFLSLLEVLLSWCFSQS